MSKEVFVFAKVKKMENKPDKTLLIAVPTNDGITVFPKMLGMAKYFNIYSTTDGKQFTFIEKRATP
jgi:hypothetical protein